MSKTQKILNWVMLVIILLIMLIPAIMMMVNFLDVRVPEKLGELVNLTDKQLEELKALGITLEVGFISEKFNTLTLTTKAGAWAGMWLLTIGTLIGFASIIATVIKFKLGKQADLDNMKKIAGIDRLRKVL